MGAAMSDADASDGAYRRDLALIHDAGFGQIARGAAATLIDRLGRRGLRSGLIVELACGSGISSRMFTDAGYDVLGYDLSPAMLELARERAPQARFVEASLYDAELPGCVATTAIGEAFNYLFDERAGFAALGDVVRRAHGALGAGGLLLFDFAAPSRALPRLEHHVAEGRFGDGRNWQVEWEVVEDPAARRLERRIASRVDDPVDERRGEVELHQLALYDPDAVVALMVETGFNVELLATYGGLHQFGLGHVGVVAARRASG